MAARIKKDDIVVVVAGDQRGARGKVLRIDHERQRVTVEGVNMVHRHVRRSRQHPQGGRVQKEAPIHLSNVMPIDPKTDRPTRVRFATRTEGGERIKERIAAGRQGSGAALGVVSRKPVKTTGARS